MAMYADGHLASVEDARVQRLLAAMGFATDYERGKHYDGSISRISRHATPMDAAKSHVSSLAANFSTTDQRRRVYEIINDVVASDRQVATQEDALLLVVREALQMRK